MMMEVIIFMIWFEAICMVGPYSLSVDPSVLPVHMEIPLSPGDKDICHNDQCHSSKGYNKTLSLQKQVQSVNLTVPFMKDNW